MVWRRALLPVVAIPAGLLLLSVGLDLWMAVPLMSIDIWVSAGLLALTLAAFATNNVAIGLVLRGRLGLVTASRYSYSIALWTASMTFLIALGILYPTLAGVLLMRVLGFYWPEFVYGLTAFCLAFAAFGLFNVLSSNSAFSTVEPLHAWGALVSSSTQPELFVVLDRLSNSLQLKSPQHILLGIDPNISCTKQTVLLEGAALEGGTLHLSLPLCRLLSEAEITSLISAELLMSQLVPPDWGAWLTRIQQKWAPIRKRLEDGPLPVFRIAFGILWNWLDLWRDWQTLPLLASFQRSAVLAGRENLASAVTKVNVFGSKWPAFLADIQTALQRDSATASRTNLSAAFADQIAGIAPHLGQELIRACDQDSGQEWAVPCSWIRSMGVDPMEIAARLAAPPIDTAVAWLAGIEAIESDLSRSRIRTMFFLPNRESETSPSAHEAT